MSSGKIGCKIVPHYLGCSDQWMSMSMRMFPFNAKNNNREIIDEACYHIVTKILITQSSSFSKCHTTTISRTCAN